MADPEKPYSVEITKPDCVARKVEFARYADLAAAELAAKALRRHGIDARAITPDDAQQLDGLRPGFPTADVS